MSALLNKSITELRGIAQSFDIPDIFKKQHFELVQAIELKQQGLQPPPKVEVPRPEYDARLMSKPPAKRLEQVDFNKLMEPYIQRGIKFTVDENGETWEMRCGKLVDTGTMRMKPDTLLKCAAKLLS